MTPLKRMIWSGRFPNFTPPAHSISTTIVALILVFAGWARCATNTVTSLADDGAGSLRQIIAESAAGDTVVFGVTGSITLSTGELVLDKDLTILDRFNGSGYQRQPCQSDPHSEPRGHCLHLGSDD